MWLVRVKRVVLWGDEFEEVDDIDDKEDGELWFEFLLLLFGVVCLEF